MDGSYDLDGYVSRTVLPFVVVSNSLLPCRRTGEPRLSAEIRWATGPYLRLSAFICVQSPLVSPRRPFRHFPS